MPKLLFARAINDEERKRLRDLAASDDERMKRRAQAILLSADDRYRVPEIARMVILGADKVRKWIVRFNEGGIDGLKTRNYKPGPPPRFTEDIKDNIIRIATTPPRSLGLLFSNWTLHGLKAYLMESGTVDEISHETLRKILKEANVDWRRRYSYRPPYMLNTMNYLNQTEQQK